MTESKEYSPFHPDLDQKYPIGSLRFHHDDIAAIVSGRVHFMTWVRLFNSSPANNSEAEMLIGELMTTSVRAGQWVDTPAPVEDVETEPVSFQSPDGKFVFKAEGISLQFLRAAEILKDTGLVEKVKDQTGRQYLRPTERLIEFIGERVGFRKD